MARIGIDLDGVLANFNAGFVRIILQLFPGRVPEDYVQRSWDWSEVLSPSEYDQVFSQAMATWNWWTTLPAYYEDVSGLARWIASHTDQEIWFVTSRPDSEGYSATYQSRKWLESVGLWETDNSLNVMTVPHSEDKVDICSRLNIDWMIDDKPETIESMDQFPYLHAALISRPWNHEAKVKWRVLSVGQFLSNIISSDQ